MNDYIIWWLTQPEAERALVQAMVVETHRMNRRAREAPPFRILLSPYMEKVFRELFGDEAADAQILR